MSSEWRLTTGVPGTAVQYPGTVPGSGYGPVPLSFYYLRYPLGEIHTPFQQVQQDVIPP
jgi:hypothetical protein